MGETNERLFDEAGIEKSHDIGFLERAQGFQVRLVPRYIADLGAKCCARKRHDPENGNQ